RTQRRIAECDADHELIDVRDEDVFSRRPRARRAHAADARVPREDPLDRAARLASLPLRAFIFASIRDRERLDVIACDAEVGSSSLLLELPAESATEDAVIGRDVDETAR